MPNDYKQLKDLAGQVRADSRISGYIVTQRDCEGICQRYGVRYDRWPYSFELVRGAYINDGFGPTIMVPDDIQPDWLNIIGGEIQPDPQVIFTALHELKHHLMDRNLAIFHDFAAAILNCQDHNQRAKIEKEAEFFAAELIFPVADFAREMSDLGVRPGECTPRSIVELKHKTKTTLNCEKLAERATCRGWVQPEVLDNVDWGELEKQIYPEPGDGWLQRN